MRYYFMVVTAALVVTQATAVHAAAPLQLECFITMKATGQQMTHHVTIDLDHHTVKDGSMRFIDGVTSVPLTVNTLRSFVRPFGRLTYPVGYRISGYRRTR